MKPRLAVVMAAFGGVCAAQAPVPVEPTVVTVTGYPLPVSTAPASITLFGVDTPRHSVSDSVADLISTSALLNVNRNGAVGGYCSITIRGGKPNFTLVMIDGIEVNDVADSLGGAVDFSALSMGNIGQVEVVRGPLSGVYGSDSVSGAIQLVSRRGGSGQPSPDITAAMGSFGTRNAGIAGTGQKGKVDYSYSGSYLGVGEQVKNDPYQLGTASLHVGVALNRDAFLGLTARFADSVTAGYPVGGGGAEYSILQQPQRVEARQFLVGGQFDQRENSLWSYGLAFDFFGRGQDLAIPAILDQSPPTLRSVPATAGTTSFQRYHGAFSNTFRLAKAFSAHVSGGYRDDVGSSDAVLGGVLPDRFDLRRTTFSLNGDVLYSIDRFTASIGFRADEVIGDKTYASPHAGATYRLGHARAHSSWGKGFKLPSFYSLGDPLIGNRLLKPEFNTSVGEAPDRRCGVLPQFLSRSGRLQRTTVPPHQSERGGDERHGVRDEGADC